MVSSHSKIPRRRLLAEAGVASGAAVLTGCTLEPLATPRPDGRVLRIAHLTDIHVEPAGGAPEGLAFALRHAQGQPDRPDIIFNGGDAIMDALAADKAQVEAEWEIWHSVWDAEVSLPALHCLGNHDVWGWSTAAVSEAEPRYGKQWALDELGLTSPYYSLDLAGWHIVVLDSTHPVEGLGYTARLDELQHEWLAADLAATPSDMPICVLSHIPILCSCSFFDGDNEQSGDWVVPGAWMHIDARRIKDLFAAHPNVRLCLSGHSHLRDEVEYLGVKYLCNGAVCGGWWSGSYQEFPPAYVLVNLYADGKSDSELVILGI